MAGLLRALVQKRTNLTWMLTIASVNFRSIRRNFTNLSSSASSFDGVSQKIYSSQAFYIYYTWEARVAC